MIYGFEMGDVDRTNSAGVRFASQPVCHTLLPCTRGRKNDSPVSKPPIRGPPNPQISLQRHGVFQGKAAQILVSRDDQLFPGAGTPDWDPGYSAHDLPIIRFRYFREIG